MSPQSRLRFATTAALLLASASVVRAADTPAAGTAPVLGDLWEVTSQMSMEEMPMAMPVQKLKICSPKAWKRPPAPTNEQQKCTNSDFAIDGPKATWKVICENPPMTGEGEITRDGPEAYTGAIKFTGDEGALTIKLNGRRVSDCNNPQP